MRLRSLDYHAPHSVEEAVVTLEQAGSGARLLAGGQSLIPLLAARTLTASALVDVNRIVGLDRIVDSGDGIAIGAIVRQADVESHPSVREHYPLLHRALGLIASAAIRHRGTVVGSLAHAEPSAELPATLAALGAEVVAARPGGERRLPVAEFFTGRNQTVLTHGELLTEVWVPRPAAGATSAIREVNRRHNGPALAGAAVNLVTDGGSVGSATISLFGIADTPIVLAPPALRGVGCDDVAARRMAAREAVADLRPRSDVLASGAYRRRAAEVLVNRALDEALASVS